MVKMGTVWDRTAEFLSDNIGLLVPLALFAYFIPASIEGNFEAASQDGGMGLLLALRLAQVAFGILSIWGTLAITAMALDLAGDGSPAGIALRRLPATLLVSIVMLVGAAALSLPIWGVLRAGGVDMAAWSNGTPPTISPAIAGAVSLYGLALFLLLLWLGSRLAVTTAVIVRERRVLSAISQSWVLTRGMALRIVGVVILYLIVSWVSQLAAKTVFGSIFALVAGGEGEGVTLAGVLTSIVVAAVQTIFMVIPPAFTAKLYLALTAQAGLRTAGA